APRCVLSSTVPRRLAAKRRSRTYMARCKRLLITLLAVPLVTSGARSQTVNLSTSAPAALQPAPAAASGREPADVKADRMQKTGDRYTLNGHAEIRYRGITFQADEMTYDESSGEVTATGHIDITGGPHDEHITASHALYNLESETGRFDDVTGTTGMRLHGGRMALTSPNHFVFRGKLVEKTGPD